MHGSRYCSTYCSHRDLSPINSPEITFHFHRSPRTSSDPESPQLLVPGHRGQFGPPAVGHVVAVSQFKPESVDLPSMYLLNYVKNK